MDDIKNLLMELCKDIMDDMAGDPGHSLLGTPPRVFYLDFSYGEGESGDPQETYRYENGSLEKVKPGAGRKTDSEVERVMESRRSYYSEGSFSIRIDKKNKYAYMSFVAGPLFGRGYRYKIVTTESGNTLGEEEELWIS